MPKYLHIVQVHPIYEGIVQTHKVILEQEFVDKVDADRFIRMYNRHDLDNAPEELAVYVGCVDDETGELV